MLLDLDGTLLGGDSSVWVTAALAGPEQESSSSVFDQNERGALRQGLRRLVASGLVAEDDLVKLGYRAECATDAANVTTATTDPPSTWGWVDWYRETKALFAQARERDAPGLEAAVQIAVGLPAFQERVYDPMRTAVQALQRSAQIVVVSGALDPVPKVVFSSLLIPKHPAQEFLGDLWSATFGQRMPTRSAVVIGASQRRSQEPYAEGKASRVHAAITAAREANTRVAALVVDSVTGDGPAILAAITPAMHEVRGTSLLRVPVIVIVNANSEMHAFLETNDAALQSWRNAGGQLHHVTIAAASPGS